MSTSEINVLDERSNVGQGDGDIDTAAFESALNRAAGSPGCIVRVPPLPDNQYYRINRPLQVRRCALVGTSHCASSGSQSSLEVHFNYRSNVRLEEAGSLQGLILVNDDRGVNAEDPDRPLLHRGCQTTGFGNLFSLA
jgi:hypothetical protein